MQAPSVTIKEVDPQGIDALALLRLAAIEARTLYPGLHAPDDPWPVNEPTPPRGVYLVAFINGKPIGMGAHRPLDAATSEVRRLYVCPEVRGKGVAERLLGHLEAHAKCQGFTHFRLETGPRQLAAMRLYEKCGFVRIPAFGPYLNDPVSICFEKDLGTA